MTRPPRPLFSSKPLWLAALAAQALKFSDQLFKQSASDSCSLLLNPEQIDRLIATAKATRAKSSSLALARYRSMHLVRPRATPGAPATHRAPTSRGWYAQVSEPLRAQWANVRAAAVLLASEQAELQCRAHDQKIQKARAEIKKFHHQLCTLRVLGPACGDSGSPAVTFRS